MISDVDPTRDDVKRLDRIVTRTCVKSKTISPRLGRRASVRTGCVDAAGQQHQADTQYDGFVRPPPPQRNRNGSLRLPRASVTKHTHTLSRRRRPESRVKSRRENNADAAVRNVLYPGGYLLGVSRTRSHVDAAFCFTVFGERGAV